MFELLMKSVVSGGLPIYTADAPTSIPVDPNGLRANASMGLYNNIITMTGGYPTASSSKITLSEDGLDISSSAVVTGTETGPSGACQVGSSLWVTLNSSSTIILRQWSLVTSALVKNSVSTPTVLSHYDPIICPIDSNRLFFGLGYSGATNRRIVSQYTISTNTWASPFPQVPASMAITKGIFPAVKDTDNKIYCTTDSTSKSIVYFDIPTNTWALTPSYAEISNLLGTPDPFMYSGTVYLDPYVLFFAPGVSGTNANKFFCIRYNTQTKKYDAILLPGLVARYGTRILVDSVKGLLYVVGGAVSSNYGSNTKYNNMLIYPISQFLIS